MELNSLLLLLEAAEYLERRDREAEHGYASVLPFDGDFARKKTKAAGLVRKAPNNRSSHNELEKHRRAKLRLYLEQLKQLVPLGPDSTRHTTLSLLKRAKMHIKGMPPPGHRLTVPHPSETGGAGPQGAEHQGAAAAGAPLPEAAPGAAVCAEHGACAHGQHWLRRLHRRLRARGGHRGHGVWPW
ncbi:max dimerization protein 4 isoform X2 [Marmota monax]|uniref:max dimerization protein 4 isoform X2 n=1 Tax=Marmota monax TaxID=9995 RepID=UPI001EAFB441|nr:max dimerization protein 4 isoform X2 [Marmota monax]